MGSKQKKTEKPTPPLNESVAEIMAIRLRNGKTQSREISLAREIPLTIFVNDVEIVTLLTSGGYLENLALGFLVSEGIITSRPQVKELFLDEDRGEARITTSEDTDLPQDLFLKRTITSGCGKGTSFYYALDALTSKTTSSKLSLRAEQVSSLMKELNARSELYRVTGGVHNTALAEKDKILIFREDIGRHNSVDKICGECFIKEIPLENKILITTGRITSEILIKTARLGIPILISRGAATSLSFELAKKLNITTIGMARGTTFTVYSGSERVIME